ncbi:MAG TPA: hypothetical protein GX506_08660 [Firmicutes bacterium]|nr:hypothetical protein [Bacillota bacterium]
MRQREHGVEDNPQNSVNLLMSILVRYPEIMTVKFDPQSRSLRLTLAVRRPRARDRERSEARPPARELFSVFEKRLRDSLASYSGLLGTKPAEISVDIIESGSFSLINVRRDVGTLTQEEISLMIDIAGEVFGEDLVREQEGSLVEEERIAQDEMIENMLDDLRESLQVRKLIGFREEGRVVVFNKSVQGRRS